MYGIHPYYDAAIVRAVRDEQRERIERHQARYLHLADRAGRRRRRRPR